MEGGGTMQTQAAPLLYVVGVAQDRSFTTPLAMRLTERGLTLVEGMGLAALRKPEEARCGLQRTTADYKGRSQTGNQRSVSSSIGSSSRSAAASRSSSALSR